MKGVLKADHVPAHNFELVVVGLVASLTLTTVTGIEEEMDVVELPDRTVVSGGRTKPIEFTVTLPMHHGVEQALMELWYREGQDPVLPTYKKPATLILRSLSGAFTRSFSFPDLFIAQRNVSDLDMNSEGEMVQSEWVMRASSMLPI